MTPSPLTGLLCRRSGLHRILPPPIQPPQRRFRVEVLADTVDVKGVIPAVPSEWAIAVSTKAATVELSTVCVDTETRMLIRVKWAEIQPAPLRWPGSIEPDQILDVVGLVVLADGYSFAVPGVS